MSYPLRLPGLFHVVRKFGLGRSAGGGRFTGGARFEALEPRRLLSGVLLPDLSNVLEPGDHPALPASFDTFTPPVAAAGGGVGAPALAEWTRSAAPDETLVLTGDQFSTFGGAQAGKDTRFLVYGQTSGGNGTLADGMIQRLDGAEAAVTLGNALPADSLYLLWAQNANGVSAPVAVNQAQAWWVGPDRAQRGQSVSVFGRNLSYGSGASASWVYLRPSDGSHAGQWVSVTAANPYKVDFSVPSDLADGTYEVWVHNGHGGRYGWSAPVTMTVGDAAAWDGPTFDVKNFGAVGDGVTDDTAAIAQAVSAASAASRATIYLPKGVYLVTQPLYLNAIWGSGVRLVGDGSGQTTLRYAGTSPQGVLIEMMRSDSQVSGLTLDAGSATFDRLLRARGLQNIHFHDVVFNARQNNYFDFHASRGIFLDQCDAIGSGSFLGTASQLLIDHCNFYGTNDAAALLYSWGGHEISVTNSTAQDFDNSDPNSGAGWAQGRFFVGSGVWGTEHDLYLGDNTTRDLGVRPTYYNQNSGEQLCWEGNFTNFRGSPTAATANTVTFAGLGASVPGDHITIVSGKGLGQHRTITGYDPATGTVTIDSPWNVIPDAESGLAIGVVSERVAIYGNSLDGKQRDVDSPDHTASTGVLLFGGSFDFAVDSNAIHQVRLGLSMQASSDGQRLDPIYSNLMVNNTVDASRYGTRQWSSSVNQDVSYFGNIYRGNTFSRMVDHVFSMSGSGGDDSWESNVVEHNQVAGTTLAMELSQTHNAIIYKNQLSAGDALVPGSVGVTVATASDAAAVMLGNTWSNFATAISGPTQGVLEEPYRVVQATTDGAPRTAAVTLVNAGWAGLDWAASVDAPWVQLAAGQGSLAAGAAANLGLTLDPAGMAPGVYRAQVTVTSGDQTKASTVVMEVTPAPPPVISPPVGLRSLRVNRRWVTQGDPIKLVAGGVQSGTAVVEFYCDANHNGTLDVGADVLLGRDSSGADGWRWTGATTDFDGGENLLLARAGDGHGNFSAAVGKSILINLRPTIAALSLAADSSRPNQRLRLAAGGVGDADGQVTRVKFYRDSNHNGVYDPGIDRYIGADGRGLDGWSLRLARNSANMSDAFFAIARDDRHVASVATASAPMVVVSPTAAPLAALLGPRTTASNKRTTGLRLSEVLLSAKPRVGSL